MSEYDNVEVFDLNDPRLLTLPVEDFDPDGSIEFLPPAPPSDGPAKVNLKLREYTDGRSAIYVKQDEKGIRIVACFVPRFVNEDGALGGFLRDFYVTSAIPAGQSTSSLAMLCRLAGSPLPRAANMKELLDAASNALTSDEGITVDVRTRWTRSSVIEDPNNPGEALLDASGKKAYMQVSGQAKVAARAQIEYSQHEHNEAIHPSTLKQLNGNWHLYWDGVSGEVRGVQSEVQGLIG